MRLEPPRWWYGTSAADRLTTALFQPAGLVYGAAVRARFARAKPYHSRLPVICIGNFTVGGAGKTPLAVAVARIVEALGERPAFLTRGFGGRLRGPHLVDPDRDEASDVGDEPLLLARMAPTVVARNRPEGALAIEALDASVIIMDDGFQNPSLKKDLSLIAVDAGLGLGNGRVFPAGPLRAPLSFQTGMADAIVLIGKGEPPRLDRAVPVLRGSLKPRGDCQWLHDKPLLAYCGIGRPAKFFATLTEHGARITAVQPFPDHHMFTEAEAAALIRRAADAGASLATTEKDWLRIPARPGPLGDLKRASKYLPVVLDLTDLDEAHLKSQVVRVLARQRKVASGTCSMKAV
jgi:tetraacyldisaccharide 4'-kinase